tara:strand:+ start:17401 stop:17904 length:504 start_codon:yes stop_codon:yes gene_type:complete
VGGHFEVWEENDTVFAATLDEVDASGNRVRLLLKDGEIIRRDTFANREACTTKAYRSGKVELGLGTLVRNADESYAFEYAPVKPSPFPQSSFQVEVYQCSKDKNRYWAVRANGEYSFSMSPRSWYHLVAYKLSGPKSVYARVDEKKKDGFKFIGYRVYDHETRTIKI